MAPFAQDGFSDLEYAFAQEDAAAAALVHERQGVYGFEQPRLGAVVVGHALGLADDGAQISLMLYSVIFLPSWVNVFYSISPTMYSAISITELLSNQLVPLANPLNTL